MKTTRYTLVFLFLTAFTFGQNSALIKNINFRAQELNHTLNKQGDSLLLSAERTIHGVSIFNAEFDKQFEVNKNKVSIPLKDIPLGRYTTEVKLNNKLIILTLLRIEPILVTSNLKETSKVESETFESAQSLNIAAGKREEKTELKKVTGYWIVSKIKNGNSSRTIKRAGDLRVVEELIKQNKLDIQTRLGKFNQLTVWEVYDKKEFMKLKRLNPQYASVASSEAFNISPYYNTEND